MCRAIASQEWDGSKRRVFVTLTFLEDDKHDGRRELLRFKERWRKRWGAPHAIWWKEYQRRGAVHYHILAEVSPAVHVLLPSWVRQNWRACGGGMITDVREWTGRADRLYSYAMKEAFARGKEYQHQLPLGHVEERLDADGEEYLVQASLGRWWGVWGCGGRWRRQQLSYEEYCDLRRRVRRWGVNLGSLRSRAVGSWWAVAPPDLVRGLVVGPVGGAGGPTPPPALREDWGRGVHVF